MNEEEKINIDVSKIARKVMADEPILDKNILSNYISLIVNNIRNNNTAIKRNSFGMIICFLVYLLVDNKNTNEISVLFFKINDTQFILNIVPICFSFLFLKNVALIANNKYLRILFEEHSKRLFGLHELSKTIKIIRPFLLIEQIVEGQINNYSLREVVKLPMLFTILIILVFPILFEVYCLYRVAVDNYFGFIPVISFVIVSFFLVGAIVQLYGSEDKNDFYKLMIREIYESKNEDKI